jgi:hypothetical protein
MTAWSSLQGRWRTSWQIDGATAVVYPICVVLFIDSKTGETDAHGSYSGMEATVTADRFGAAKGPKPVGFGNCWVVAGIVVELPFLSRPVCLPILARLWGPRRTGKIAYAREMADLICARYPERRVHVVGDAAYVGEHLRGLEGQITWTSRLKVTSVLHELPPPRTGRSGRPRTKGARLGTATDVATIATARAMWRDARVRRYGRTDAVQITEVICLWYGSFHSRTVRVVLVRDNKPRTRNRDDRGY